MPIWLRNFTYHQISDFKQKEQQEINKSLKGNNSTSTNIGDTNIPPHIKQALTKPSYKTKTSKK